MNMDMEERESVNESTPLKRSASLSNATSKWHVLSLCCFIMSVMYYILAMPAALHNALYAVMPGQNFEMNFNMLFTISYVPNMVLPLFGGAIVDQYGQAQCLVLFGIIVGLGQLLATMGVYTTSWGCLLMGRLLFGLGAQNLIVANASLISKYFAGKEGVALGLSNVCSYAGVIATNMLSPKLSNVVSPAVAFGVSVLLQFVAVGMAIWIVIIDRQPKNKCPSTTSALVCSPMYSPIAYRRLSSRTHSSTTDTSSRTPTPISAVDHDDEDAIQHQTGFAGKLRDFKPTFWWLCVSFLLIYGVVWSFTNVSSGILLERDFFLMPPSSCTPQHPTECTSGTLAPEKGNPWKSTKECSVGDNFAPPIPSSLNMTIQLSNGDDGQSIPFDSDQYIFAQLRTSDIKCQDLFWSQACTMDFCEHQAQATEKAGFYMSIPYFFTVALTFHLGLFVDATGYRTELICFGSLLLVISHAILAYPATAPPTVPLITQGLGYTICVAALWPSVPFTVNEDSVGLAFGIMMAVQNVGLAVIPMIVAKLYSMGNNQYLPMVEIFFALCSLCAVAAGVALMISDRKTGEILGSPKRSIRFDKKKGSFVVNRRPRSASDDKIPYDFAIPM